jgi:Flp pilus assembly protein TadG
LRLTDPVPKLAADETGSFMSTAVFLAVVIGILAVLVIDGSSVFYANQAAADGAQEAANLATVEYRTSHNDGRAEIAAADYCEAKDLEFIDFRVNREAGHTFDVICGKQATTYVFKYIPVLKELIPQESRKTSNV